MSYYYLISGLPNLSLDQITENVPAQPIDVDEILDTIQRNLEPSDEQLFRYLIYPHDNHNLLNILFAKHSDLVQSTFITPALLSQQDLLDYHKHKGSFPSYMSAFLDAYEDQFSSISPSEMENKLLDFFYEDVGQKGPFIAEYYRFERSLKGLFSAYNHSYFDFLAAPVDDEVALMHQVGQGKSIPSDLLRDYPYIEEIAQVISTHQPAAIEMLMDRIKWDYLDEVRSFFSGEQVFAYTLRLLMVHRWQTMNAEKGAARFQELQEGIKNKVRSLKTPVI
ncbi:MAG: DUF2764 family protein [Cyclobacteriaceae bacterium]